MEKVKTITTLTVCNFDGAQGLMDVGVAGRMKVEVIVTHLVAIQA
jgi:hypothetical protein